MKAFSSWAVAGLASILRMRFALLLSLMLAAAGANAQTNFSPKLTEFLSTHPKASLALSNVLAEASSPKRPVEIYYFYTNDESVSKGNHHYFTDSIGIFVRENQPVTDEYLSILFQVLSLKGEKHLRELRELAKSGGISKTNFVREVQRQQFQTVLATRDIVRTFDLKPEEIVPSTAFGGFIHTSDDFEAFLQTAESVRRVEIQKAREELEEEYDRFRRSKPRP